MWIWSELLESVCSVTFKCPQIRMGKVSAVTSCGSPRASPSIFSIFLMMATFWCARKGYSILLGVGAPWLNKSVCYDMWPPQRGYYKFWLNVLCTRSLQWWSLRHSTVTQCDATWRDKVDITLIKQQIQMARCVDTSIGCYSKVAKLHLNMI